MDDHQALNCGLVCVVLILFPFAFGRPQCLKSRLINLVSHGKESYTTLKNYFA